MTGEAAGPYKISHSLKLQDKLKAWAERAVALGLREELRTALRGAVDSLQTSPYQWGDPIFTYPQLKLPMFHRIFAQFYICYGIYETDRVVFIKEMTLLSNHPLESP